MGKTDILLTILMILLAVTVASMVYLSNLKNAAFDNEYYEEQYRKNGVYAQFPQGTNLTNQTSMLLDYLKEGEGEIQTDFFNQREKTHLAEVRGLFRAAMRILDGLAVLSVLLMSGIMFAIRKTEWHMSDEESRNHFRKRISQLLLWTGYAVLAMTALFVLIMLTFDTSFITFHKMFFKTDTWMLDPATDNLIKMMPEQFFYDTVSKIMSMSSAVAAVMILAGIFARVDWKARMRR